MKDDLLDADASVRWAETNLPSFEQRLNAWLAENVDMIVKELPDDPSRDGLVVCENARLPRFFTVEAGAYLNAIRSSLDVLMTAIGKRDSVLGLDDAYFPVARNADAFVRGDYKGSKVVRQLSGTHRKLIEGLKPYPRGNNLLVALHHLDNRRKHRALLNLSAEPNSMTIGGGKGEIIPYEITFLFDIEPEPENWTKRLSSTETLIALVPKGFVGHQPDAQLEAIIRFNEAALSTLTVPLALKLFIEMADAAIKAFDI
jgi:hypothetical protein